MKKLVLIFVICTSLLFSACKNTESLVDVDLSVLSTTVVYAEVYNMCMDPDSYLGNTVKMTGTYMLYHDDYTGNDYHVCLVQDVTACCSQGLEFVLTPPNAAYPTSGELITIIGEFSTYEEDGLVYCTLKNAELQ